MHAYEPRIETKAKFYSITHTYICSLSPVAKWASLRPDKVEPQQQQQQQQQHRGGRGAMTTTQRKIRCMRICQKLIYGLGLFFLVLLLLIQTVQCLRKYFQEPTFISTEIVRQNQAEFPALTFCPETGAYKLDVLQVGIYTG